jgi:hypothetical protein
MLRKTTISVPFGFLAITVLSGCGPGVGIDLVPVGLPDSSGPVSFCKPVGAPLVVTVKNQGSAAAPASTTKVEFNPGGSFPIPHPLFRREDPLIFRGSVFRMPAPIQIVTLRLRSIPMVRSMKAMKGTIPSTAFA